MIEETVQILDVEGPYAWVESERVSACGSCGVRQGCGSGVLASVLGRRRVRMRVLNRIGARIGDHVVVGISESWLLRGSLAVYAVPLLGLFAGALSGYALGSRFYPNWPGDPAAIAGALAGFIAALAWLRRFSRKSAENSTAQPVVLRHQIRTGSG